MLHHAFEIIPTGWDRETREGLPFQPLVIEVPALTAGEEDRAARRAYFSAMALLASQGIDVDQFQVFQWSDETGTGAEVGPGGIKH
jgi:hypothetical protein